MKLPTSAALIVILACVQPLAAADAGTPAETQPESSQPESPLASVRWLEGPAVGELGNHATVQVPEGFVFANGDDARKILEYLENPTDGTEVGFLKPKDAGWFVLFEFEDVGYVRDDDRDELDADAILESIRRGTEEANKTRRARGWTPLKIEGWEIKPAYNPVTHNLEWATRASSQGVISINENIRLLGRYGVMSAVIVGSPEELVQAGSRTQEILSSGYAFKPGKTYAEFRSGDKIAKYGLVGLITGGAAVVALKTGVFKYLWKILVVGGVAVAGFFKRLFGRKSTG